LLHWHILTAVLCADLRHRYTISESVGGRAGTFRGRRMLLPLSVDAAFWPNNVRRVDRLESKRTRSEFARSSRVAHLANSNIFGFAPRGNRQEKIIVVDS
jgi:hypothetical protein